MVPTGLTGEAIARAHACSCASVMFMVSSSALPFGGSLQALVNPPRFLAISVAFYRKGFQRARMQRFTISARFPDMPTVRPPFSCHQYQSRPDPLRPRASKQPACSSRTARTHPGRHAWLASLIFIPAKARRHSTISRTHACFPPPPSYSCLRTRLRSRNSRHRPLSINSVNRLESGLAGNPVERQAGDECCGSARSMSKFLDVPAPAEQTLAVSSDSRRPSEAAGRLPWPRPPRSRHCHASRSLACCARYR